MSARYKKRGSLKVSPLDPRMRGRQDVWVPPTTNTGPPTPATTVPTGEAEPLQKGAWVWHGKVRRPE